MHIKRAAVVQRCTLKGLPCVLSCMLRHCCQEGLALLRYNNPHKKLQRFYAVTLRIVFQRLGIVHMLPAWALPWSGGKTCNRC